MGAQSNLEAERNWTTICNQQNWNPDSQITHLEGFLRDRGLFEQFVAYAQEAANEENGNTEELAKADVLSDVGYSIVEDVDQPGLWLWTAPSDGSETSYASEDEAIISAWNDAAAQTIQLYNMSKIEWDALDFEKQKALIMNCLSPF